MPEALVRIKEARRTEKTILDLSGLQLTALPELLWQLTSLEALDLSNNNLTTLPESLAQLTSLELLNLHNNQLTTLPESLGQLTSLQHLYLYNNQLTTLPESLARLTSLQTLYLFSNQLTILPESLTQLTSLRQLSFGANQLTTLPESLAQLTSLQELYLFGNQLTILPESLGQLTSLEELGISSNQLATLPASLGQLTSLQHLNLSHNQLTTLPETLGSLRNLETLFFHANPALEIPESVLGPGRTEVFHRDEKLRKKAARPADILNFYFERRKGAAAGTLTPVNEIKMMLVGRGGAGKTSLRRYFMEQPHDKEEQETPGIALDRFLIHCHERTVNVGLWDFAGQEITHALHQFFLTEGCVYVLVLDPRSNTEMRDAEYWLGLLDRYAGGAPVVVALNRQDARQGGYDVDRPRLEERFPFIREFILTNCETRDGCDDLKAAVHRAIESLKETEPPHLEVQKAWLSVMRTCVETGNHQERQHLTFAEFRGICAKYGETDPSKQESLARLLHKLGVVLHFVDEPRLRDTSVLNPHWVTDGVYRLLRYKDTPKSDGTLTIEEALAALPGETEETARFLLRLMERFEMCFPLDETEGGKPASKWLIPGALDEFQPTEVGISWQEPGSVRMRYSYDPLSEGVIPRFIVMTRLHSEGKPRWRNGVVLEEGRAAALVRRGEKTNHLEVTAFGPDGDRLRLLEIIQGTLDRINADIPDPRPVPELELSGLPVSGVFRPVADLEAAEVAKQQVAVAVPPDTAKVDPTPQLNRTSERASRDGGRVPLRTFLSYSHSDKRAKAVFQSNLTVLMKKNFITTWHDGLIEPGTLWREEIEDNLERMDVFIGLLTTEFLASDFIDEVELSAARERLRNQERDFIFVLILVDNISLAELDLAEYQILKPGGKAVSQHPSRKQGFDIAQKELEKLLADRQRKQQKTVKREDLRVERMTTHKVSQQEGVTIIVQGNYIAAEKFMKDDHSIHIGGNVTNAQVGQTLTNCTNMIQQQAPGAQRDLLETLQRDVQALIEKLPGEDQEETVDNLERFVKEATADKPNRKWYSVSAEGLLDASKFVKDFSGNIAGTVGQLGKLIWPDFSLSETKDGG